MTTVRQKYKGPAKKINVRSNYPNKKLAVVSPRNLKVKVKKS